MFYSKNKYCTIINNYTFSPETPTAPKETIMHDTSLSFSEIIKLNKSDVDIDKFNPYHDSKGKFTTSGGGASFSGVLLHGSPHKGIKEFDISRAGSNTGSGEKLLFFTNDKQMADDFSYERLPGSTKFMNVKGKKGEVYRTKVNMKKPLDLRNLSDDDIKAVRELDAEGILSDSDIKMMAGMKNHGSLKAALDLRPETLSRLGYDGLIANAGNGRTEFAVIDSKQTKILNKSFSELAKFNPYHDRLGRFASSGGATSFTWRPGASAAHDKAITREKERTSTASGPKPMTEQEYLDYKGVGDAMSGYTTDKLRGNRQLRSRQGRERFERETLNANAEYQKRRDQARQEYREKVKNGELRDKTKLEQLVDRANGHPDNPATQAARRIAEKRGIDWRTGEPLKKSFSFLDIFKFNPNHDNLGRFSSGNGGAAAIAGSSQSYELSESNKEYLRAYTSGNYKDCCAISQSIEQGGNIQSGSYDAHEIEQTKQIMKAIDSQPVTDGELVRIESGDVDLKTGDTFTWGIRSTSRDTEFGDKVLNQADEGTENLLYSSHDDKYLGMVEYRIVGEKKALDISSYSEYDQQESLVKGKFKVLSVDKSEFNPPESKTFEQAVKDNPSLKDRYEEFTSKKGNSMVRDNETGQTYTKDKFFGRMVYYNGNMIPKEEYDIDVDSARRSYKRKTVVKVEQVL